MREILFRAKDHAGNWHLGVPLVFSDNFVCIAAPHQYHTSVIPETVGQFTGLTDKNGKRIFEGDIVEYKEEYGEIEYHDKEAMFVVCFDTWLIDFDHLYGKDVEIIGNTHDNPELLKND